MVRGLDCWGCNAHVTTARRTGGHRCTTVGPGLVRDECLYTIVKVFLTLRSVRLTLSARNGGSMRTLIATVLALSCVILGNSPAFADYHGTYRTNGFTATTPQCMTAGVNIVESQTPDRHNASVADSCDTQYEMVVLLVEFASDGTVSHYCIQSNPDSDYAQCGIQESTSGGQYWAWTDELIESDGTDFENSCTGSASNYSSCFHSSD